MPKKANETPATQNTTPPDAPEIKLSVRALAEFLLRSGNIDSRFTGLDRGTTGTRLHRQLQKMGGKAYKAEVPLAIQIDQNGFSYLLSGRADGVIEDVDGKITVDEIKTTAALLDDIEEDENPAHWAQACIYAHILCTQRPLISCTVQLTYCNIDTEEVRRFTKEYTAEELASFVQGLLQQYHKWAVLSVDWTDRRNAALQGLQFPFTDYRDGQRPLAIASYNTCKEHSRLFCCAPTGIGKTISTLFPAMKALGEGHGERIFYLTAKTVTRQVAEDTLTLLHGKNPLPFHSIILTAKDTICFLEERACLPEICPYANGYYDRVNDAVYDILCRHTALTRELVEEEARKHQLCPYELSLDLALWCDCIICDYNYLFDPVVYFKRFFEGSAGEHIFLIDEAHNLVDRSREMYSAALRKSDFFDLKKELPRQYVTVHKALTNLNNVFVQYRKQCQEADTKVLQLNHLPEEMQKPLAEFTKAAEDFFEKHRGSEYETDLLQLYFTATFYQRIAEEFGQQYTTLLYRYGNDVTVRLFCLDPSAYLDESLAKGRAAVMFSATLLPLPYYRDVLGSAQKAKLLNLSSPFNPHNLGLFIADSISTKYTDREASITPIAHMLAQMTQSKTGNYIAFFPSYSYMQQVIEEFAALYPHIATLVQQTNMDTEARDAFLAEFTENPTTTTLGFCVMGGIFAEGVDLPGSRLIGTAVVGVGLPQIGPEPNALRDYYEETQGHGFEYAYQFPGMNKVLQAAGRVIRTPEDKGIVLLIDSRFSTPRYQAMFPKHWQHWQRITPNTLEQSLAAFWQNSL